MPVEIPKVVSEPTPTATRRPMRRNANYGISLFAYGEPMIWLTGGALAIALLMIVGLLSLVLFEGIRTFWPGPVQSFVMVDGKKYMGEVTRVEQYRPGEDMFRQLTTAMKERATQEMDRQRGFLTRRLVRTGNFDVVGTHFHWIDDFAVDKVDFPQWAILVERQAWGRFYGTPSEFKVDGKIVASTPESVWSKYLEYHDSVRDRWQAKRQLENSDIRAVNERLQDAKSDLRAAEMSHGRDSREAAEAQERHDSVADFAKQEFDRIQRQMVELDRENRRYIFTLATIDGQTKDLQLSDCVRAYPANQLDRSAKMDVYGSRWAEFLGDEPREANSEGGVYPAIFGTVAMTLIMSLAVVPFGVLAALYLREYAKAGPMVSAVRIAINNLAGVPSIVFGVFGLGFFCYIVGGSIDQWLFAADLPSPTFGKGGLLWASLTLALLTLPVVIVATEESLAAVPSSMREGSYACGASKWQTIRRIVLPRAMPGIMTGMILAMARGAGEVAPLMLVGAVKLAPELPIDGYFPYIHAQRSFMHLGFHIYDLGFQSPNSEAAKPMVYTTAMLLITIVFLLNVAAIWLRSRLRRRYQSGQF